MNERSEIVTGPGGTTFAGPEAVDLFRAVALKSGISMYAKCGMKPNSMWTPTNMLAAAGRLTGKKYKLSRSGYAKAIADLEAWIVEARREIPVVRT